MEMPERTCDPGPHTEVVDCDRIVRDPSVSAVMITYNHEPYIAQAIEGVVSQETDFPIELIIGEDCSTDRTREIVLDYQRRYPELIRVLLTEKNLGMHANFRRTILAARGKHVAFCEGDDWWHRRDKLQTQIHALEADSALVLVSAGIQRVSAEGQVLGPGEQSDARRPLRRISYEDIMFGRAFHHASTVVARTDAVRQAVLGDTLCADHRQLWGDMPLWLELSQMGATIQLGETLASYRQSPNSATRQRDPLHSWRFNISGNDIRYRALERYPLPGDPTVTSKMKARLVWRITIRAAWVGDAKTVRTQFRRLRSLGDRPRWREIACLLLAFTPLPRRALTVVCLRLISLLEAIGVKPRAYFHASVLHDQER
jgi:glycosyltransferase involved in cell wall biosynthesis